MSAAIRLKQLQEQRGAKLKEASALAEPAKKENRALKPEEFAKIQGIQSEVEDIENTILVEARQLAQESQAASIRRGEENAEELAGFSFGRLIKRMANGEPLDGVEAEVAQEGRNEAREAGVRGTKGAMIPLFAARQIQLRSVEKREAARVSRFVSARSQRELRDLTATTGTTLQHGGVTIATDVGNVYDALMERLILRRMGITVLEGLRGNLTLPRLVADTEPGHKPENTASDEKSPTFTSLTLTPRRLPVHIEVSNQLFLQSEAAIETIVRNYAFRQLAVIMEKKWINGGGAGSNEPEGILGTTGIGAVVGGTNGAAPDWADIVDLESEVAIDNADEGTLFYLTNAKVRGKLKKTVKVSSTDSMMIWDSRNGQIDGWPVLNDTRAAMSNIVPSTLVKGSSGAVASAIIYGNFADYIAAFWSGIEVLINPYSKDTEGLTRMNFAVYYDGGVIRPVSFSAMQDALTT